MAAAEFTWGSFQYDATAAQYAGLCKQEAKSSRNAVLVKYNITVGLVQPLEGDILEGLKVSLGVDVVDPEVVGDDTSEIRKLFEGLTTVTEVLNFLREQSWDLWCGVPYVAKVVFPELNLGEICHEHELGTYCWLLKSYGFVKDDEPFKGWDT